MSKPAPRRPELPGDAPYREIFQAAGIPCLLFDPASGVLTEANPAACRLLGGNRQALLGLTLGGLVAPSDGAGMALALGELGGTGAAAPLERNFTLITLDGQSLPLRCQLGSVPSFTPEQAPCGFAFLLSPPAPREAEQELTGAVFETVAEALFVTDADCRIITVNPAFTQITGFDREEMQGQRLSLLSEEHNAPAFFDRLRETLAQEGRWQGEIWNKRKNGEIFAEWLSVAAVRDPAGRIQRYVGAFSDITRRKEAEAVILRQANYDPLTDLPNRALFQDRLAQVLRAAERRQALAALLFLDLDRFKQVNDTLGHAAGDQLLREVAVRLRHGVRKEDTVARLGGDEFTVILPELSDGEGAAKVARKLLEQLERPFILEDQAFQVSASIGIAIYPLDGQLPDLLLRAADQAMYRAKQEGRNGYWFANRGLGRTLDRFAILRRDLPQAIAGGALQLLYQPIVDLGDEHLVAFEASLRWPHPELGAVLPEEIRDAAQEAQVEAELDDWGTQRLGEDLATWDTQGEPLRVMLRMHDLGHPERLRRRLHGWLERHPAQRGRLALVVDEAHLNRGGAPLVEVLAEAGTLDFSVAIDHYGVGYTPFSHLLKLPLAWLKIDRGLVNEAMMGGAGPGMIESIIRMARNWNLKVIASGIESHEQHWLMKTAGCDLGQGGRFPGPLRAEEVGRRFAHNAEEGQP
jgi:diguanylate cyclase (GGDEF)-like protein/PAS domain S-box-containing protein